MGIGLLAAACAGHSRPGVADQSRCAPVTGVALSASWDSLPGTWRLTLVATSGPAAGRASQGRLTLRALDDSLRLVSRPGPDSVTVPIVGSADIPLEQVGAERVGNVLSADPERPGVAIWVSRGADGGRSAVMRIGEEQIHSNLLRFEGAYTVLYLRQVSATGIYGGWASSSGVGQQASGHFCATRASS